MHVLLDVTWCSLMLLLSFLLFVSFVRKLSLSLSLFLTLHGSHPGQRRKTAEGRTCSHTEWVSAACCSYVSAPMFKLPTLLLDPWRPCRFNEGVLTGASDVHVRNFWEAELPLDSLVFWMKQPSKSLRGGQAEHGNKILSKVQIGSKSSLCLPSSSLDFSSNPLWHHPPKALKFFRPGVWSAKIAK